LLPRFDSSTSSLQEQAHRLGKSQLVMRCDRIRQKKDSRPRFSPAFRLLWVVFSQMLDTWEDLVHLMKPATVKKWHSKGFRLYWRWKSGRGPGRPPIPKDMKDLIRRLSGENPLWGAERIRDTLLLLVRQAHHRWAMTLHVRTRFAST
jgi:hypothetical protein